MRCDAVRCDGFTHHGVGAQNLPFTTPSPTASVSGRILCSNWPMEASGLSKKKKKKTNRPLWRIDDVVSQALVIINA